jgi:2,4-dienoyl-CoA reductase-like NADH-dependent reductase (Old Yellow Enzyme family)
MTSNKHDYVKGRETLFMQKFPHLFSPIKIAGHTYKNRILSAPMLFSFYALDEGSADRVYKIVEERAKGGVAEVVVGETPINYEDAVGISIGIDVDYTARKGPIFEAYKRYADIIKKHDAIANIELFHGGIRAAMSFV